MLNTISAPGFERSFSLRLKKFIRAVPADAVTLQMNSQADFVAFKILPTNQKSAGIEGEASTQGGITFTVGRATSVELSTGREDRFFQICEAIFTSQFSESLVHCSKGRVLYSQIRLEIKGRNVRLGGQHSLTNATNCSSTSLTSKDTGVFRSFGAPHSSQLLICRVTGKVPLADSTSPVTALIGTYRTAAVLGS